MNGMEKDHFYMGLAIEEAEKAGAKGEVPIGSRFFRFFNCQSHIKMIFFHSVHDASLLGSSVAFSSPQKERENPYRQKGLKSVNWRNQKVGSDPRVKQHKKEKPLHFTIRFIFIFIGATMAAAAIELFLVPNAIIDGGIIGISLILDYLTLIPFGILLVVINLPFLYYGYKHIGRNFFISSISSLASFEKIFRNTLH